MQLQQTIYIDSVFLLNLVMDLYLLKLTTRILGKTATNLRIFLGSLLGAAGYCMPLLFLPGIPYIWKILLFMLPTEMLMIKLVCRTRGFRELLRGTGWMLVLSFLLGGFTLFLKGQMERLFGETAEEKRVTDSATALIGMGALGYVLIEKGIRLFQNRERNACCQVRLLTDLGEREITALIDTGNGLREPVSSRPVAILDEEIWKNMRRWMKPEKYKVIPYHSLGKDNGLMEAYEVESICVRGTKGEKQYEKVVIALYRGKVSGQGRYQMILPPELAI